MVALSSGRWDYDHSYIPILLVDWQQKDDCVTEDN